MSPKREKDIDLRASGRVRALDARDAWLSVPEAAHELGLSRATVRRRCAASTLDARKVLGPNGPEYQVSAASVRACLTPDPRNQADQAARSLTHARTQSPRASRPRTDPGTKAAHPPAQAAHCPRCQGAHLAAKTAARRMGEARGQVERLARENAFLNAQLDRLTAALAASQRPWWRFWR